MFGCGVLINLQKAFDTVNHSILLQKMKNYGIRGTALNWFTSYLSEIQQYVSVNGNASDQLELTCGVPQGSVLGPLLFLICINDLPNVSKFLSFFLFADDTNIYFKSHDLTRLQKIMNRELKKVKKWLDANRLALNIDKTNFVVFYRPHIKIPEPVLIRFGRKKIKRRSCVKFRNYPKNFPGQLGSFIKSGTFVDLIFCEYFIILCFIPFCHMVFLFGV